MKSSKMLKVVYIAIVRVGIGRGGKNLWKLDDYNTLIAWANNSFCNCKINSCSVLTIHLCILTIIFLILTN